MHVGQHKPCQRQLLQSRWALQQRERTDLLQTFDFLLQGSYSAEVPSEHSQPLLLILTILCGAARLLSKLLQLHRIAVTLGLSSDELLTGVNKLLLYCILQPQQCTLLACSVLKELMGCCCFLLSIQYNAVETACLIKQLKELKANTASVS